MLTITIINKKLPLMLMMLLGFFQATSYAAVTLVENKQMRKIKDIEVNQHGEIWLVGGNSAVQWDPTDFRGKLIRTADRNNQIIVNKQNGELRAVINKKVVLLDPERLPFLTGMVKNIAIGKSGNVWAVTSNNSLYQHVGSTWQRVAGKLSDVAIGINGQVWGLADKPTSSGYPVLMYKNNQWAQTGAYSNSNKLAVDGDGEAWIFGHVEQNAKQPKLFRHKNGGWVQLPDIAKPSHLKSDLKGNIWVSGVDASTKRYPVLYQWDQQAWRAEPEIHIGGPFALLPNGTPIFPSVTVVESNVPQRQWSKKLWQTANLNLRNFTIDQQGTIWAIRNSGFNSQAPEILTWDGNLFSTAVKTKTYWQGEFKSSITDNPTDLAIDKDQTLWIIANSQIYQRKNNQWVKADNRYYLNIISSPQGDIYAVENTQKLSTPDPINKRHLFGRAIYRIQNGKFNKVAEHKQGIFDLAVDKQGGLWTLSYDPDNRKRFAILRLQNGVWNKVLLPKGAVAQKGFANGVDGSLWLTAKGGGGYLVLKWDGSHWSEHFPRVRVDKVNSDPSGNFVAMVGGAFVTTHSSKVSNSIKTSPAVSSSAQTSKPASGRLKVKPVKSNRAPSKKAHKKATKRIVKNNPSQKKVIKKKPAIKKTKVASIAQLAGCWKWSNGAYIVIDKNGIAKNGVIVGKWQKKSSSEPSRYIINWPSIYDYVNLSANGSRFSGKNTFGFPVSGERLSGRPQSLIGKWKWFTGINAVISAEGTVKGGSFSGYWKKQDNGFAIEWPIIDQIALLDRGKKLTVKNQFGAVTAIRDQQCSGP